MSEEQAAEAAHQQSQKEEEDGEDKEVVEDGEADDGDGEAEDGVEAMDDDEEEVQDKKINCRIHVFGRCLIPSLLPCKATATTFFSSF